MKVNQKFLVTVKPLVRMPATLARAEDVVGANWISGGVMSIDSFEVVNSLVFDGFLILSVSLKSSQSELSRSLRQLGMLAPVLYICL